jgi:hypothetical protein
MAVTGVVTSAFNAYCQESLNPAFAHIWVSKSQLHVLQKLIAQRKQLVLDAGSSIVASYCLDQVNFQLKDRLGSRRTSFQLWCIKAVLFLSLYQSVSIMILSAFETPF